MSTATAPHPNPEYAQDYGRRDRTPPFGGMSLRDYFAAMAMQAILKNYSVDSHDLCALNAYDMADAMLKAREGGTP